LQAVPRLIRPKAAKTKNIAVYKKKTKDDETWRFFVGKLKVRANPIIPATPHRTRIQRGISTTTSMIAVAMHATSRILASQTLNVSMVFLLDG